MKLKIVVKGLLIGGVLLINSACGYQPILQPIPLQTIFSSNNCGLNKVMLRPINSTKELDQLLQSILKNFGQAALTTPKVDFEKQSIVLYALGQKPSSGYNIELYRPDAILKKQKLYLPVRTQQPASGSMQAQLITSPCSIYSFPRTDYLDIVIEDGLTN